MTCPVFGYIIYIEQLSRDSDEVFRIKGRRPRPKPRHKLPFHQCGNTSTGGRIETSLVGASRDSRKQATVRGHSQPIVIAFFLSSRYNSPFLSIHHVMRPG